MRKGGAQQTESETVAGDDGVADEEGRVVDAVLEVGVDRGPEVARAARGRGARGHAGAVGERGVRVGLGGEGAGRARGEEQVARALVGHPELRGAQEQLADRVAVRREDGEDARAQLRVAEALHVLEEQVRGLRVQLRQHVQHQVRQARRALVGEVQLLGCVCGQAVDVSVGAALVVL